MNKTRNILIAILLAAFFFEGTADDQLDMNSSPVKRGRREKLSWIFGLGWNAVDDNGMPFKKLFAFRSVWNIPFYPSQLSAEIIGKEGFSYGAIFNYNRYKSGKQINSEIVSGRFMFFSFDAFAKYHFKEHVEKMNKRYDPYLPIGLGYTLRFISPYNSTFTFNVGAGINIWFTSKWGMNLQTVGKLGLRSPFLHNGSNYMHHSGGVVYIIDNSPRKKHSFVKPRYKWVHDKHNVGERRR